MTALEIRIIAYALLALGVMGVTAYATHRLDGARYEALQADYSKYQARVQTDAATAQEAARAAIQAQFDARTAQEAANAKTIASLTAQADAARSSADFAQRLLASALEAGTATASHPVPAAGHQPGAADTSQGGGDQPAPDLARDVADSASECRDAIERLSALQVELQPQLRIHP
jgi:hypothetical protein